jgi:hypothetical protein
MDVLFYFCFHVCGNAWKLIYEAILIKRFILNIQWPCGESNSNVPRKKRRVFFYKCASFNNEGLKSFDVFRICKGNYNAREVIPAALGRSLKTNVHFLTIVCLNTGYCCILIFDRPFLSNSRHFQKWYLLKFKRSSLGQYCTKMRRAYIKI